MTSRLLVAPPLDLALFVVVVSCTCTVHVDVRGQEEEVTMAITLTAGALGAAVAVEEEAAAVESSGEVMVASWLSASLSSSFLRAFKDSSLFSRSSFASKLIQNFAWVLS